MIIGLIITARMEASLGSNSTIYHTILEYYILSHLFLTLICLQFLWSPVLFTWNQHSSSAAQRPPCSTKSSLTPIVFCITTYIRAFSWLCSCLTICCSLSHSVVCCGLFSEDSLWNGLLFLHSSQVSWICYPPPLLAIKQSTCVTSGSQATGVEPWVLPRELSVWGYKGHLSKFLTMV